MTAFNLEWKNTPDLYNDYAFLEEIPRGMKLTLLKYGWVFDDDFFYWIPRFRKGKFLSNIVKRRPLYWYPQRSTPAEKSKQSRAKPLFQRELIL